MELLEKLGINWSLLVAQVVNFAILLGVLSYFVYRPFLNLLDARTERVRKAMEDVKKIENQAKEMEEVRREQLAKIDAECGVYLERIRRQSETMQEEMLGKARRECEELLERAQRKIDEERERMMQELLGKLSTVIVSVAGKVLGREFSPADEQRILASVERDIPSYTR